MRHLLLLCIFSLVCSSVYACDRFYTTVRNDTCAGIASSQNISLASLFASNPSLNSSNCANFTAGATLCIQVNSVTANVTTSPTSPAPTTPAPTSAPALVCILYYTAGYYDTCYTIASQYGLNITRLVSINPGVLNSTCQVYEGLSVCVAMGIPRTTTSAPTAAPTTLAPTTVVPSTSPPTTAAPTTSGPLVCVQYYTTRSGDSCFQIASTYSITTQQLQAMNPGMSCSLPVGTVLCVQMGPANVTTSAPTTPAPTAPAGCTQTYQVVAGDICDNIAAKEGVTTAQILALNPKVNSQCTNLQIGQILCIAGVVPTLAPTTPSPLPNCLKTYYVASGDSCSSIALAQGLSLTQIIAMNPGLCGSGLQIGQALCLSRPPAVPCTNFYTVTSGDNCSSIAVKEGVTVTQIMGWNPTLDSACDISAGQSICVSVTSAPATTAAPVTTSAPTTPAVGTTPPVPTPEHYEKQSSGTSLFVSSAWISIVVGVCLSVL